MSHRAPSWILAQETRALLTRLGRLRPFALQEPMLAAAAPTSEAMLGIEGCLSRGRRALRAEAIDYLRWLASSEGHRASPESSHRRYVLLRLRFNLVLSQFDLFSDAITQRSESGTGVWLAGLDAAANDALVLPGIDLAPAPLMCYLDRGPGGAIRRARTRLPGGDENPVAIIRVPRERMIGAGVASSLVHEVGHQGAALLELVQSLRPILQGLQRQGGEAQLAWRLWERWISEILADLWAVARVGAASTLGLMGVVSVPRPFQFQIEAEDPHPAPYIRVLLSAAIGDALYPHPQWSGFGELWRKFYPTAGLDARVARQLAVLQRTMPALVAVLLAHRPARLHGRSLGETLSSPDRHPHRLAALWRSCRTTSLASSASSSPLFRLPPTLAFATLAQARVDGNLDPETESRLLANLLTHWALQKTLVRRANGANAHTARAVA